MQRIYLDSASTTPLDSRVRGRMLPYLCEHYGNPSSIHSFGQLTKNALEDARETVARLIGAKPSEIIFTSGGTESDNLAIKGVALATLGKRKHLVSSTLEHKAVLESLEWLRQKLGFEVDYIGHDTKGRIDLDDLRKKIRPGETALISIMHANNELGNLNPIPEIARFARDTGTILHTDAVQSVGKIPVNVSELGADLLSLSAHKFCGPKGIGALFVRQGTLLEPLLHGGSHERNRRAGTEDVASAVGLAEALRLAIKEQGELQEHILRLRKTFLATLGRVCPNYKLNGDAENALPHILNISFDLSENQKLASDVFLLALDAEGLAVSSGSACTSGAPKPSHVLLALGCKEDEARTSIRVSFSKQNTMEESDAAARIIGNVLTRLRQNRLH
ncbi:MAG: cysteine desulfurase [Chlorobiales bacterium]|nr:cysteine desulfurase [Chlorobiales bacterium]